MSKLKHQDAKLNNRFNSETLSNFLEYLRDTRQLYNMAMQDEKDSDDATQDLLHSLEIDGGSYHEIAKLSKVLRKVRIQRRMAKDKIIRIEPIAKWVDDNPTIIKGLERLLGEVRKAERSLENRMYHPKTDIIEKVRVDKERSLTDDEEG